MTNNFKNQLKDIIPPTMDVPSMRLMETNESNIGWLLRNLRVNNNNHPEINETINQLRTLRKKGKLCL